AASTKVCSATSKIRTPCITAVISIPLPTSGCGPRSYLSTPLLPSVSRVTTAGGATAGTRLVEILYDRSNSCWTLGLMRNAHAGLRSTQRTTAMSITQDSDVYFDPYDVDINADPYPTYARLREEAPAYYNARYDFWALSRHADVEKALVNWQVFSST